MTIIPIIAASAIIWFLDIPGILNSGFLKAGITEGIFNWKPSLISSGFLVSAKSWYQSHTGFRQNCATGISTNPSPMDFLTLFVWTKPPHFGHFSANFMSIIIVVGIIKIIEQG